MLIYKVACESYSRDAEPGKGALEAVVSGEGAGVSPCLSGGRLVQGSNVVQLQVDVRSRPRVVLRLARSGCELLGIESGEIRLRFGCHCGALDGQLAVGNIVCRVDSLRRLNGGRQTESALKTGRSEARRRRHPPRAKPRTSSPHLPRATWSSIAVTTSTPPPLAASHNLSSTVVTC